MSIQAALHRQLIIDQLAASARLRQPSLIDRSKPPPRAYKPDHRLFLHAYSTMGITKDETIHVGMGQFTDLKVCQELGIRSVWIDRDREPLNPAWQPDAVLKDLSGLPDLLLLS
ncbi:HAD family hydrolase [Sphingomonas sp. PAMC26645]|uniref:HAD family hydrolase n=1 Tax=Sphingomonas sp. PAMC26645 TaxID=2565555 RepID=UPI00109E230A|nr:HAD family hydrolase [Sphingomonas sp. PAMC26645]QCB43303.1 HAD family hydrolase [Sphingomonas sp. PAMC26645]